MTGSPISDYGYPTPYGIATPRIRTSVAGLGVAAVVLLALDAAMAALATGFLIWRRSALAGFINDPASADPNAAYPHDLRSSDTAAGVAMGWFTIFTLATIVVFICWFWAARNNAEAYSPGRGSLGVGWSVGGWFVPVAGLVLPCIVARDIHRGTMLGRQRRAAGGGQLLTGWWWAAYVAFWIMGLIVTGANGKAQNDKPVTDDPVSHLQHLQSAVTAGIVALLIGIAAALLAIAYVATITREQKARNRAGAWYGGPGSPVQAPPYGMPYGYGIPGYPMPGYSMPSQPMPGYPMPSQPPAPPTQDAIPVTAPPVAETQTAEVQEPEPPKEPGAWLLPPN